jgi:hypothetical protein
MNPTAGLGAADGPQLVGVIQDHRQASLQGVCVLVICVCSLDYPAESKPALPKSQRGKQRLLSLAWQVGTLAKVTKPCPCLRFVTHGF